MIFALSTSFSLNWSELLNVGLIYQAAAQGCESCKLMLIVNRRLKRCKMSPPQKRWKANSSSSSATALLAAASIELKLYRVWYTGFYGLINPICCQAGANIQCHQEIRVKGPTFPDRSRHRWMQPALPLSYLLSYHYLSANAHINENLFLFT